MAFFKRREDNTLSNLDTVITIQYQLLPTEHLNYNYPIDGWYWFDYKQDADKEIPLIDEVPLTNRVTMRQARLALLSMDILQVVDQYIASMEGIKGEAARIEWEFADFVEKNSPIVQMLVNLLGKTQEEIDAMFEYAITL